MVYYFTCDPTFLTKNLIPDPQFSFDPWSQKNLRGYDPDPRAKILIPDPKCADPWSHISCQSLIPDSKKYADPWSHIPRHDPEITTEENVKMFKNNITKEKCKMAEAPSVKIIS